MLRGIEDELSNHKFDDGSPRILEGSRRTASILTGGTDLVLDIESGKSRCNHRCCTRLELKENRRVDGFLEISAAATLTEFVIRLSGVFPIARQRMQTVGSRHDPGSSRRWRECHYGAAAADAGMSLSVLDPRFVLVDEGGTRECGVDEMYAGFGVSTLDSGRTLMTKIRIPLPKENEAASFQRLELRKSLSLPMLNVAAMASIKDGRFEWVRLRMAPVGKGPVRAVEAEEWLVGKEV